MKIKIKKQCIKVKKPKQQEQKEKVLKFLELENKVKEAHNIKQSSADFGNKAIATEGISALSRMENKS